MAWKLELKELPEYNTDTEMKNMKKRLRDIKDRMRMANTLSGVPE